MLADTGVDYDNNYWVRKYLKLYSNLDYTGTNYTDGKYISSEYESNDGPENRLTQMISHIGKILIKAVVNPIIVNIG